MEKVLLYEEENGVKIYFARVPIDVIRFNPHNPNVMGDEDFEKLRKSIESYGYIELAVVAVVEENGEEVFYVVDGEHRIRALMARGYTEAPVLLVEGLGRGAVLSGAYVLNKIRGRIDPARLNQLIRFLGENYAAEDIAGWLDEPRDYVERILRDAERDTRIVVESVSSAQRFQRASRPQRQREGGGGTQQGAGQRASRLEDSVFSGRAVLTVPLAREDYDYIVRVLRAVSNNTSEAILEVVRFYAEQNGLEVS